VPKARNASALFPYKTAQQGEERRQQTKFQHEMQRIAKA
jgi:hypothetical protein